jgi:hypothetical protein
MAGRIRRVGHLIANADYDESQMKSIAEEANALVVAAP